MSVQGHKRLDPESVGIPVYPKAYMDSKQDAAGASFEWDSKKDGEVSGFTVVGAEYLTDDSPDKVLAFYKNKLGTWVVSSKSSGETQLEFTDGKWKRVVAIREENGRTHIGIASVGTPAGN